MQQETQVKAATNRDLLEALSNSSEEFLNEPLTLYIGRLPKDETPIGIEHFARVTISRQGSDLYYSEDAQCYGELDSFEKDENPYLVAKSTDPVFEVIDIVPVD